MKADMNERGVIVITPETGLEAYALKQWAADSIVYQDDPLRAESCHVRGSRIVLLLGPMPSQETS